MPETYHQKMTTNARMVSKVLTRKKNTFYALRELIDNSINADAKNVHIDFISSECDKDSIQYHPIEKIVISDDGIGVPFSEFENSIMQLATENRPEGYGVGRFSALQIGKIMKIATVGYDKVIKKWTKTEVTFNVNDFRGQLENKEFDVESSISDEKLSTGFNVEISSLYQNDSDCKLKNKIYPYFNEGNFSTNLFEVYHQFIFNGKTTFIINGKALTKDQFIEGQPTGFTREYKDLHGDSHNISFVIYTLNLKIENGIKVILENGKSGTPLGRFRYSSVWVAPEQERQFVLITSDYINEDLRDKYDMSAGDDKEWKEFSSFLKNELGQYYKNSNAKYKSFISTIQKDKSYPFNQDEISENSLQVQLFNSSLFMLNNDQDILDMNDKSRKTFYKMFKSSIEEGNVEYLIKNVLGLSKDSQKKMTELIDTVNLDEVIRFASSLTKRQKTLRMLQDITVRGTGKNISIWENGGLERIINNNFWLFGEQYEGMSLPMKDTDLYKVLSSYIKKDLEYVPLAKDNNLDSKAKPKVKKVKDFFLIKERILSSELKEVIIAFVKSPATILNLKEFSSYQNFIYDLQSQKDIQRMGIKYVIFYVGSQMSAFARPSFYSNANEMRPFFLRHIGENELTLDAFVYEWNELLAYNEKKMQFMGDTLKINEIDTLSTFIQEYENSYQPSSNGRMTMER